MRKKLAPLFTVAITGLLIVGLACRAGQELSEEEYFQQLQAISDSADAKFQPLVDLLNVEYESESEEIEAQRDFFEADLLIVREIEEDVGRLLPPESVRSAHREYTAALAHLVDVIARLTERMREAQSRVEIEALLADAELEAATDRLDGACFELQALASGSNMDVDLDCE